MRPIPAVALLPPHCPPEPQETGKSESPRRTTACSSDSFSSRWPAGWFSMRPAAALGLHSAGLRGAGLAPIRVVERATGRLVGTVDEASAHLIVHEGAVYVHQGDSYLVQTLDLADRVALVEAGEPGYTTTAKTATEVEVRGELRAAA